MEKTERKRSRTIGISFDEATEARVETYMEGRPWLKTRSAAVQDIIRVAESEYALFRVTKEVAK